MTPGSVPAGAADRDRDGIGAAPAVVDASVALKWVVPEVGAGAARSLQRDWAERGVAVYAPDLLWSETANALWRRARGDDAVLGPSDARELFAVLRLAPLRSEPLDPLAGRALEIAVSADITAYDAAYVALAEAVGGRLWTADRALAGKLAGTEWAERVEVVE